MTLRVGLTPRLLQVKPVVTDQAPAPECLPKCEGQKMLNFGPWWVSGRNLSPAAADISKHCIFGIVIAGSVHYSYSSG